MKRKSDAPKRPRGRPKIGSKGIHLRIPPDSLKIVDSIVKRHPTWTRQAVILALIDGRAING